jgi:hypothetical protein
MGSRENFSIFISNIGGNYAVELQNGEIREFFPESPNNFLGKFFASGGINCNYSFSPGADTINSDLLAFIQKPVTARNPRCGLKDCVGECVLNVCI